MKEYIEREAAINKFSDLLPIGRSIRQSILEVPTADVAPVKHGMWIFINEATNFYEPPCGDTCKCSECQYIIDVADTKFNYCPNCGAKMKEN